MLKTCCAYLSFFVEKKDDGSLEVQGEATDTETVLEKVKGELEDLRAFCDIGEGTVTVDETGQNGEDTASRPHIQQLRLCCHIFSQLPDAKLCSLVHTGGKRHCTGALMPADRKYHHGQGSTGQSGLRLL